MWYGEILFRQGWWARRFDTPEEASSWAIKQSRQELETTNPARDTRVREHKPPVHPPRRPDKTFDEAWPEPKKAK